MVVGVTARRSLAGAHNELMPVRIKSFELARGMVTFVGNQKTVSQTRSRRVSQIQMVKQRYELRAGPVYQPSRPCADQVSWSAGFSCTTTRMPSEWCWLLFSLLLLSSSSEQMKQKTPQRQEASCLIGRRAGYRDKGSKDCCLSIFTLF